VLDALVRPRAPRPPRLLRKQEKARDRRQLDAPARPLRARAREGDCAERGVAGALLGQARVAGEAPGAVHEHTDSDPFGLRVRQRVDLAVLGGNMLRPAHDAARVRVVGSRADRRVIDAYLGEEFVLAEA